MTQPTEMKEGPTAIVTGQPESKPLSVSIPDTLTRTTNKTKAADVITSITGNVSIRPYIDGTRENMGLEKYNLAVYPGTYQEEQLAAIERNGVIRYITGLDEFAPEVQKLDPAKKEAVIRNIRYVVSELEKQLATNEIKVDDENFWSKVTLLKPNNIEFWQKITLRCGNDAMFLQPKTDPYDLIKMMAIEAGGFDLVAKSYEDAQTKAKPPKFYLDKEVFTVATRTEYKKIRNKAISLLDALYGKNPKKLSYIAKVLDINSTQYKNSTPQDVVYENLDTYIQGDGVEKNKTRAAENFIKATELDMETLKLKALVKDASFYKFIVTKPDGMIYHSAKSAMMGRNVSDLVEFLKNPLHEDVLQALLGEVEKYWNQ
jgi:hypothetical protein